MRVRFLTYLLAVGLIAVSLVLFGCGGEGQQNSQDSQDSQNSQNEGSKDEQNAGPHWKTFKGAVTSVQRDEDNFTVKRKNGNSAKTFIYKPDRVRVKQDAKKVGPDAIEEGQLVRVTFVHHEHFNVANSIRIRSKTSGASSGETTG